MKGQQLKNDNENCFRNTKYQYQLLDTWKQ